MSLSLKYSGLSSGKFLQGKKLFPELIIGYKGTKVAQRMGCNRCSEAPTKPRLPHMPPAHGPQLKGDPPKVMGPPQRRLAASKQSS